MLETIISFIALILVLVLAYFSTRYFAKTMHKMQSSDSMHIVESMMLERDKKIVIVKIQNRFIALATHANGVENLGECDGYIERIQDDSKTINPFESILNQFIHTKGDKHEPKE